MSAAALAILAARRSGLVSHISASKAKTKSLRGSSLILFEDLFQRPNPILNEVHQTQSSLNTTKINLSNEHSTIALPGSWRKPKPIENLINKQPVLPEKNKRSSTSAQASAVHGHISATAIIRPGTGRVTINHSVNLETVFSEDSHRIAILEPLTITKSLSKYNVNIFVPWSHQREASLAARSAIGKALIKIDPSLWNILSQRMVFWQELITPYPDAPSRPGPWKRERWSRR